METIKIFILLLIFFCSSLGFSQTATPGSNCGAVTYYSDLKGDGSEEKIVLTNVARNIYCLFQSLTISENEVVVYKEEGDPDSLMGNVRAFSIEHLRKGPENQIFLNLWWSDAAGSEVKVIEWQGGKYLETLAPRDTREVELKDLENDGIEEIVSYGDDYGDKPPDVYDFDPVQEKYVISNSKHPAFYRQMIATYEAEINKSSETGHDCCTRAVNLGKMINAALIIGDQAKAKEAANRLSDVFVEYGKAYYREKNYSKAVQCYSEAIEKNEDNWRAFGLRGYSYLRNHQVKEAVDSLEHSIELNPGYIDGHYNLALAYWACGDKQKEAISEVKKVIDLDPSLKEKIKSDFQFNGFKTSPAFNRLVKS